MRSKAPLMMIEQMVMLLVFALAAVLCLQAFTLSQNISQQNVYRDRAVICLIQIVNRITLVQPLLLFARQTVKNCSK